ncbi:unnamed protein product [Paramecium primaurelia]|uniref:Transmembrane protein n=1 Tax=Paramecium primaurelia TaxID=5886 RepID=A0A8S1QRB5_PARPR|nr:unnamed protein product [Paramecium primaurelia]
MCILLVILFHHKNHKQIAMQEQKVVKCRCFMCQLYISFDEKQYFCQKIYADSVDEYCSQNPFANSNEGSCITGNTDWGELQQIFKMMMLGDLLMPLYHLASYTAITAAITQIVIQEKYYDARKILLILLVAKREIYVFMQPPYCFYQAILQFVLFMTVSQLILSQHIVKQEQIRKEKDVHRLVVLIVEMQFLSLYTNIQFVLLNKKHILHILQKDIKKIITLNIAIIILKTLQILDVHILTKEVQGNKLSACQCAIFTTGVCTYFSGYTYIVVGACNSCTGQTIKTIVSDWAQQKNIE